MLNNTQILILGVCRGYELLDADAKRRTRNLEQRYTCLKKTKQNGVI